MAYKSNKFIRKASGFVLCDLLPEDWDDLNLEQQNSFLEATAWEPFDHYEADFLWETIESLAIQYERLWRESTAEFSNQESARLAGAAPDLLAAVEQALVASEDGGDMNDIDWEMLREARLKATKRPA